jgi:outer membrane lipoprotein-sorting protein
MVVQRERTRGNVVRRVLTTLSLLTVLGLSTTPRAAQPPADSFDELYARGQRVNASIHTLTASFTETTASALLVQPLVARGTLAVERPSRVVLRYAEPNVRTVLIENNRMTTTWPTRQTLDVGTAMGRVERMFVNGTAKELRRQFTIDETQTSDRPGTHRVLLTPRQRRIREGLSSLELWVDRKTSLLAAMRMVFPNGDSKLMTFSDVTPNQALAPGTFTLDR